MHPRRKKVDFYLSPEWLAIRYQKLQEARFACEYCAGKASDGFRLDVHHFYTRAQRPDLELDPGNLVVTCRRCHVGVHAFYEYALRGAPAANESRFQVDPVKPESHDQLSLWDEDDDDKD